MPSPFITTTELSNLLGRDVTSDPGGTLAINAACDIIRDITEQDFIAGTTTESFDGTGTDVIVLPQRPVTAAGTVLVNGGTVTDYFLSGHGLLLRGTVTGGCFRPRWPLGRQNVRVTYEHGFQSVDIPNSIKAVAWSIASRLVVQGVAQSETIGDTTVNYGMSADDLTAGELRILQGYLSTRSF